MGLVSYPSAMEFSLSIYGIIYNNYLTLSGTAHVKCKLVCPLPWLCKKLNVQVSAATKANASDVNLVLNLFP